jgi:hypothetical protein
MHRTLPIRRNTLISAESPARAAERRLRKATDDQRPACTIGGRSGHRLAAGCLAVRQRWWRGPSQPDKRIPLTTSLVSQGRVATVEVSTNWRAQLGADALPSAVLAAYGDAVSRRMETWAAEINRGEPDPAIDDVDPTRLHGWGLLPTAVPADGPVSESAHHAVRRLWTLLEDASDRLDNLVEELATASGVVATGRDPNGHVTVTMSGGQPAGLDIDPRWAAGASGYEIGKAITDAIASGYAALDRRAADAPTGRYPFSELARATADPARWLADLGLTAPTMPNSQRRDR